MEPGLEPSRNDGFCDWGSPLANEQLDCLESGVTPTMTYYGSILSQIYLTYILTYILTYLHVLSDMPSGTISDINCDILPEILSDVL